MRENPSLWSRMFGRRKLAEPTDSVLPAVRMRTQQVGSSGTQIFSGRFEEEYLRELKGKTAVETYDKMRRSDPQVAMILSAVKNPIKGATWSIEKAGDDEKAKRAAELMEHILFCDLDKSWSEKLHEILSMVDFGHSIFEPVHKNVLENKKFGAYTGLASFGFRSQRTIERWNLDPATGKLKSLTQYSSGDVSRNWVEIPAEQLVVFTLNKEGDNYEGISMLRAVYGPFFRKSEYQKLMAIGIEKFAVPTPIAKVPEGKENSVQLRNLITALEMYTSHQAQYLLAPKDWDIDLNGNNFDASKVQAAIDAEDKAMVKAFLANFLELGMSGGGGSYSLSFDQSDFFLAGIEHVAKIVCDVINAEVIPQLCRLNFGPLDEYPKLKCSGISDKAGKELADVMKLLVDGRIIVPDNALEEHARERFGLPKATTEGQRQVPVQTPGMPSPGPALAANGSPATPAPAFAAHENNAKRVRLAEVDAKKQITAGKADLKQTMQEGLKKIGNAMVSQIMSAARTLPDSRRFEAISGVKASGVNAYRESLTQILADMAGSSLKKARAEVPRAAKVKLGDHDASIQFGDFKFVIEDLPKDLQKKVKAQANLLTETQIADLEKNLYFQFTSSIDSTGDLDLVEKDLKESADDFIGSASIEAGAGNVAAHIINESRSAFFFAPETLEEIQAFQFVNGDPVSPICQDLAGRVFAKDDPEAQRFFPPLHHNCKSYIVPVLVGAKPKEVDPTGLKPSDPKLEKYVTLDERETPIRLDGHDVDFEVKALSETVEEYVYSKDGKAFYKVEITYSDAEKTQLLKRKGTRL